MNKLERDQPLVIGGVEIAPGQTKDVKLEVSQTFTGGPIHMPVRIIRAREPGPVALLTAAVHGDEINGTGVIRELVFSEPLELLRGALICVPVVDVFGFEVHNRYMPDGRDLNRSFPGSESGSLAARFAHTIMSELVAHADFCIDFHSAAATRTNFPNVRGDMSRARIREIAKVFGCELILNNKGPEGSLRRSATATGCPTIILEAGEPHKIEPSMLEIGLRGVRNVLIHHGMIEGAIVRPAYQTRIRKSVWLRASLGGLLRFHVAPGEVVSGGQPIATNESIFGVARSAIIAPTDGIVLGMTTHPAVKPGEPVAHLAIPTMSIGRIRRALAAATDGSPESRAREDLATNIMVTRMSAMPPNADRNSPREAAE